MGKTEVSSLPWAGAPAPWRTGETLGACCVAGALQHTTHQRHHTPCTSHYNHKPGPHACGWSLLKATRQEWHPVMKDACRFM